MNTLTVETLKCGIMMDQTFINNRRTMFQIGTIIHIVNKMIITHLSCHLIIADENLDLEYFSLLSEQTHE